MKRRDFLKLSSQAGFAAGLSQLLPLTAWAAQTRQGRTKYLITIHLQYGADVTLGLDPQVKDPNVSDTACFLGYRPDEIVRAGQLRLGPSAAKLAPYARQSRKKVEC